MLAECVIELLPHSPQNQCLLGELDPIRASHRLFVSLLAPHVQTINLRSMYTIRLRVV